MGSGRGGNYTQVVLFGAEDGGAQAGVAEPAAGDADRQNPVMEELRGMDVDAMTSGDAHNGPSLPILQFQLKIKRPYKHSVIEK